MIGVCVHHIWLFLSIIRLSCDSICHWNLNSVFAQKVFKITFLRAISLQKFDAVCLSETYLDSATSRDDNNFEIPGYHLLLTD